MKTAIFIISHNRADRVETYDTLRNAGYTGQIYVVIDDEDPQKCKYVDRFGKECIVFRKEHFMEITDTISQEKKKSSPVYARNFVEFEASKLGIDAFGMFDDDVKNLRYRWVEDGKAKSLGITKNLDIVIDTYMDYMVKCDMAAVSFANVMLYVGGVDGIEHRIIGNREMYQIHFRNAKFPVEWKSNINNDTITELLYSRRGYHYWSLPFIVYDSPKMNTLPGGMKAVYDSLSEFDRAFMATISVPSVCSPVVSKNHIVIGRNKKVAYPVVVSQRYKR